MNIFDLTEIPVVEIMDLKSLQGGTLSYILVKGKVMSGYVSVRVLVNGEQVGERQLLDYKNNVYKLPIDVRIESNLDVRLEFTGGTFQLQSLKAFL
jgi:hypothetical protein